MLFELPLHIIPAFIIHLSLKFQDLFKHNKKLMLTRISLKWNPDYLALDKTKVIEFKKNIESEETYLILSLIL